MNSCDERGERTVIDRLEKVVLGEIPADLPFSEFALRYHRWLLESVGLLSGGTALIGFVLGSAFGAYRELYWLLGVAVLLMGAGLLGRFFAAARRRVSLIYFGTFGIITFFGTPMSAVAFEDPLAVWLFMLSGPHIGMPFLLTFTKRAASALFLGGVFVASLAIFHELPGREHWALLAAAFGLSVCAAVISGEVFYRVARANWHRARGHAQLNDELEGRIAERSMRLREVSLRLLHLREDERAALAHELHDQMSQRLTALRHFSFSAREGDARALDAFEEELSTLHEEVRDTVRLLGGAPLNGDLSESLAQLAERFRGGDGCRRAHGLFCARTQ